MKVVTSSMHNNTSDDKTPTYNNGSQKHSQWTFYLRNVLEADTKDKTPRQVDVKSVQIRSEKRHQFVIYIRTDKCRYCCRQKDNEHEGLAGTWNKHTTRIARAYIIMHFKRRLSTLHRAMFFFIYLFLVPYLADPTTILGCGRGGGMLASVCCPRGMPGISEITRPACTRFRQTFDTLDFTAREKSCRIRTEHMAN